MPRFAVGVAYDGTDFNGWQLQENGRSVQGELEAALGSVANEAVRVHAAGRTDTGVSASAQVAHFDASATRTSRQWLLGANSAMADDVAVQWVHEVPADFDARRDALFRTYSYQILRAEPRNPLLRRNSWWVREALDVEAMRMAAAAWIGEHDFSSFRAAGCQSRSVHRHMMAISITGAGDLLRLEFTANAFLYHMVRNLVGTLVDIGTGRHAPGWSETLLAARDRRLAGATAPAAGLCLVAVGYDPALGLPIPPH